MVRCKYLPQVESQCGGRRNKSLWKLVIMKVSYANSIFVERKGSENIQYFFIAQWPLMCIKMSVMILIFWQPLISIIINCMSHTELTCECVMFVEWFLQTNLDILDLWCFAPVSVCQSPKCSICLTKKWATLILEKMYANSWELLEN